MKNIVTIVLIAVLSYLLFKQINPKPNSVSSKPSNDEQLNKKPKSLNIVFLQDGSGSTKKNGIEIVTSNAFQPYFAEIHRNIQLSFGIISDLSTHSLITVELPFLKYKEPIFPDLQSLSIIEQESAKKNYEEELEAYKRDSSEFILVRQKHFTEFCQRVDSALLQYRKKLSDRTDLKTAISVADKSFNYSFSDSDRRFLLVNSDGIDSYRKNAKKLLNKADVLLIGANDIEHTNVDLIVTKKFQSPTQAIAFTISN